MKTLEKWTPDFTNFRETYRVVIHTTGLDCDGPIDHGVDEYEMTYEELALKVGLKTMHGYRIVHEREHRDGSGGNIIFEKPNDENGYSRVNIEFTELVQEYHEPEDTGRDNWRIDGGG